MKSNHPQPMESLTTDIFPAPVARATRNLFASPGLQPVLLAKIASNPEQETAAVVTLAAHFLHPNERTRLHSYRFTKRRSEFLTGRICAKLAVLGYLRGTGAAADRLPPNRIEIANDNSGRPLIAIDQAQACSAPIDISISHSGEFGAALAADCWCGIDLQLKSAALGRVRERFCSDAEQRLLSEALPGAPPLTGLALLWAAKEAAKKALSRWRLVGFEELVLAGIAAGEADSSILTLRLPSAADLPAASGLAVLTAMFGEYALALCLLPHELSHAGTARG